MQAVDKARVDYLASLIARQTPPQTDTLLIAKLMYAHFVGVQQLSGLITAREWEDMDSLLLTLLTEPQ